MPNAPHKEPQYGLRISSEIMDKLKYIADCISGYVQFPSRGSSSKKISSISLCSSPKEETSA